MQRILCLLLFSSMLIAVHGIDITASAAEKTFKGRVIYVNSTEIEVKRGKTEMIFAISPGMKVTGKKGDTVDISALEPCQVVTVTYAVENDRKTARSIAINTLSDCHKKK